MMREAYFVFSIVASLGLLKHGVAATALRSGGESVIEFLPDWASTWCMEQELPPLPYDLCPPDSTLNVIELHGGMTNALRQILLGAILSFQENRCFYVDEEHSNLNSDGSGFLKKYFEPIGLDKNHPIVQRAYSTKNIQVRDWHHFWDTLEQRKAWNTQTSIPLLHYDDMEGHFLKRIFLRRMWRPLPHVREETCRSLASHNLGKSFLSFSVRRGDKTIEKFAFTQLSDYIYKADEVIGQRFNNEAPPIFVATDDCTVLPTFRSMRPNWRFESACEENASSGGYVYNDMSRWTKDEMDGHFRKFFVELYALATSEVYIGVAYTNVAWWAFFMRSRRSDFILLDKRQGLLDEDIFNSW